MARILKRLLELFQPNVANERGSRRMTTQREEKIAQMSELISRLNRDLRLPEKWPDVELTMPQVKTLVMLSNGSLRMSDIAGGIGSSLSATTAMIDRLIEKQLVIREHDTVDRRVVTCRLSKLGSATLDAFWQLQQERVNAMADLLSNEELDVVNEALSILVKATRQ